MIRVRALGPLELSSEADDVPAPLRWRKNSALLVYLALSSSRGREREHLCGLLWPEKPESSARHSLNEALRVLRKSLPEGAIEADARRVALQDDAVDLDTGQFESALEAGDLENAAALIRGEFLEGFGLSDSTAFEDWLAAERRRWREQSVRTLAGAAEARMAEGDVRGGAHLAQRALALDPYSDLAAQAAVRGLALEGDRGGALSAYETFGRRLAEDLGAEPAPETERLADRVKRERTWRLPAALSDDPQAPARLGLVGRDEELGRLVRAWAGCRQDGCAAVLMIEGEPGVGKTRLLHELASRARLDGGTVAGIRCVRADRDISGSGLRGLCGGGLLDAPGLLGAPNSALAAFIAELPEWAERLRGAAEAEPAPTARAFSDLIGSIAEEQPTLLFVDDAEWLDPVSRDALTLMIRDQASRPLSVVLGGGHPRARPMFDELSDGVGDTPVTRILIDRWDEAACGALVEAVLPEFDDEARDRLARRVVADSAGLPLLAVEIVRAVRDGLEVDDGGVAEAWPETDRTLEQTLPSELPDTARSAIRIGFRRLSAPAQKLLAAASVIEADRFEASEVQRLTDMTDEESENALEELEWFGWLDAEHRGYGFVARIVRDVIASDMLTPGQQRKYRERLTDS